jgi:hypothetical protein
MSHFWWYLARSSGLVAWVLLVASLVMGTMASGRLTDRSGSRRWLLDLHPWVSGLALSVVVLHIAAIVADSFVTISWQQALVPFASPWRATAVAWGANACWRMVAVQFTSMVRNSMPKQYWHAIHMSSYVLAVLATLHAVLTGSDVHNRYVTVLIAGGVTIAVASSLQRAFGVGRMRREERRAQTGRDVTERARVRTADHATTASTDAAPPTDPAAPTPGPTAARGIPRRPESTTAAGSGTGR